MKALLGRKLGMTQLFDQDGSVARVTLIQAGPCVVTQVKTAEKDGYDAVQIGFEEAKHQAKPQEGHLKAAGANSRVMREIRVRDGRATAAAEREEISNMKVGDAIAADVFEAGDKVQVTATSKGKGFAGTIKRHNFKRGPKTHGSHNYRQPGSIGALYPEHTIKGMRMAGQMGAEQVTVTGLKVFMVDAERGIIAVRGAVPGPRKGLVTLRERA